jgi:hypothetical protein
MHNAFSSQLFSELSTSIIEEQEGSAFSWQCRRPYKLWIDTTEVLKQNVSYRKGKARKSRSRESSKSLIVVS